MEISLFGLFVWSSQQNANLLYLLTAMPCKYYMMSNITSKQRVYGMYFTYYYVEFLSFVKVSAVFS